MYALKTNIPGNLLVYLVSFAFIALNTYFISGEFYYFSILPLIIVLLWLVFFSLDKFIFLIVFLVPLSIPLTRIFGKMDVDLYLPTEPFLAGVMLVFFIKYLQGHRIDIKILRHPLSIAIYLNIAWIFITSLTSSMPIVSFKFLVVRIWFIITFYLLAAEIFKSRKKMRTYVWVYVIPFLFVIIYVITKLSTYGLTNQQASNFVVDPFFNDHTSYGAILAMLIPVLIGLFIIYRKIRKGLKFLFLLLLIIYFAGLVLSYTRAAWLSLILTFGIFIIIKLRIKWQFILAGLIILLGLFFSLKTDVLMKIEENKQASSGKFTEHLQSMSNVRNDESNLERLNRWSCAIRMFKERPVFGWGAGTYMFQYGSFQSSSETTSISTNAGVKGNAHSEYLGPLSEQGIFGLLSILSIIIISIWTGLKVYFKSRDRNLRIFILSVLLGLCTYYLHGLMNNFLDTDKASALFWGFSAMLVAADVYQLREGEKT